MSVSRHLLAALLACGIGLSCIRAEAPKPDAKTVIDDASLLQAQLKAQFDSFKGKLAILAGRLENGTPQDKEKARALRAAVKLIAERGVDGRFDSLIRGLKAKGADQNIDILATVLKDNEELRSDLRKLIALLAADDRDQQLKDRREAATKLMEKLKDLRAKEARIQALTEMGKLGKDELKKAQEKVTAQTREVLGPKGEPGELGKATETEAQQEMVRKPIEEAVRNQEEAEKQLGKGNTDGASDAEGKAVARLDEAIRVLDDHLNQVRKEEKELLLANLLTRIEKMLAIQTQVRDGTVNLDADINKSEGKKATVSHAGRANKLADAEEVALKEADSILKVLEGEGSAVAFTEVFQQVRKDIQTVRDRLARTDTGKVTVTIENDVIETLKEMISALKKAQQENNSDLPPPHPGPTGDGPERKKKLIELVAELKLLHAQQNRVNSRTSMYGRRFKGEQVPPPETGKSEYEKEKFETIRTELADLADRQQRLGKVTRELAKKIATREEK